MMSLADIKSRLNELKAEVATQQLASVEVVSRSRLVTISTELRSIARQITQRGSDSDRTDLIFTQELFKGLVDDVKELLLKIQKSKNSSLVLLDNGDPSSEQDKRPPMLSGVLRKQGDKGITRRKWKTRYFKQQGASLAYYSHKEATDPLGAIAMNAIVDVVRKDRINFDVVTPQRTYHLQVIDASYYEEWVTKLQEWAAYFKQLQTQRMSQSYSIEDRTRQEDNQRILMASINNYEASTEILEKKIQDMKEQIAELDRTAEDRREQLRLQLLKEVESYDNQISTIYQQLRQKEEQLATEEKKSDQILLTVSKDASKLVLLRAEHKKINEQISRLQEELTSHTSSITRLEESIDQEMRKSIRKRYTNKTLEAMANHLNEKRMSNQHFQNLNSQLTLEIALTEDQFRAEREANEELLNFLTGLISGYEAQYDDLVAKMVLAQGATLEMVEELELLKEYYFNSVLLRSKLQYQLMNESLDLDFAKLYANYEYQDFREWPTEIERYISTLLNNKK
eukprot:TRINITY_DN6041_c0_g1_i2.p1 TRINITY_DN6041_c0_g1~~TRINITY_DN6041_c0_g1_i2.p1  ORF type:complete len:537 (+),score=108.13 TRINITY_DN6041_c0_g1_i2:77-1612(+)